MSTSFEDQSYVSGPIRAQGHYVIVPQYIPKGYHHTPFVQDRYDQKCFWARCPIGIFVEDHDGILIYVPPRPDLSEDNLELATASYDYRYLQLPSSLSQVSTNHEAFSHRIQVPGLGSSFNCPPEQQLAAAINDLFRHLFHKPSDEERKAQAQKQFEESLALYHQLHPIDENEILKVKNQRARSIKIGEMKQLLKDLKAEHFSDDQLVEIFEMKNAFKRLRQFVEDSHLEKKFKYLNEILEIGDQEVSRTYGWFKNFVQEITDFDIHFPTYLASNPFDTLQQPIQKVWNTYSKSDENLQVFATSFFGGHLTLCAERYYPIALDPAEFQKTSSLLDQIEKLSNPKSTSSPISDAFFKLKDSIWKKVQSISKLPTKDLLFDKTWSQKISQSYEDLHQQIKDGRGLSRELAQFKSFMIDNCKIAEMADFSSSIVEPKAFQVGEKNFENCKILGVNGIMTPFSEAKRQAQEMSSSCKGYKVDWLYVPNHSLLQDLSQAHADLSYRATEETFLLRDQVLEYFNNSSPTSQLYIQCHSKGTLSVRNMLLMIPSELKKRISIIAFAPAGYINDTDLKNIQHFASPWDIVPMLDQKGREQALHRETLTLIEPNSKTPFWDHAIDSPTFTEAKAQWFERILENEAPQDVL